MVKQTIQIFARVKPTKAKTGVYDLEDRDDGSSQLTFFIPKELAAGLVNNKKENYKFKFEKVFDQKCKQEDIFENVAKPVIDNVVKGYNGTIFAYGQTGSGKTFTITGGAEKYSQRGIIPRTLSYIFEMYEKMPEREFSTNISYLEIYNENGYDLLDPKHEASKLEDLPKVALMEDEGQNIHLKNLSIHPAGNEEDALNLLFLGDTNRMIAETPMNQASTRSHCIFTIHLMSKEVGSATVRRSKLHLVDLAGSERVSKTGVNGIILSEAKYINLSLHYLEQVIVALSEKSRSHIPYRNSMMTSVLRDSLGGNCMTTMIATCNVEKPNIDESVSTCRFAQRVAMIKNDALLNEEMDPRLLAEKLKKEVALLKEELAMATGEQRSDDLTENEISRCNEAVDAYIEDKDGQAVLNIGGDMRKIQLCYSILKTKLLSRPKEAPPPAKPPEEEEEMSHYDKMELKKLQHLLLQRDNEINILVNMLKKEKKRAAEGRPSKSDLGNGHVTTSSAKLSSRDQNRGERHKGQDRSVATPPDSRAHRVQSRDQSSLGESDSPNQLTSRRQKHHTVTSKQILGDMSVGRQQAFEIFKRDYHENQQIEGNKNQLRQKYAEAKKLGELVNKERDVINKSKTQLEHYRVQKAMQGDTSQTMDDTESDLKDALDQAKRSYKEKLARLKSLKTETEHLQHYLERSKVKLMKDFEFWWAEQMSQSEQQPLHDPIKSAWRTPPPSGSSSTSHSAIQPGDPGYRRSPVRAAQVPPLELTASGSTFVKSSSTDQMSLNSLSSTSINSFNNYQNSGYSQLTPASHVSHQPPAGHKSHHSSKDATSESHQTSVAGIQLTGDAEVDANILAFVKARSAAKQLAQSKNITS